MARVNTCAIVVLSAVLLAVTGCIPTARVVWSPDGQRAAVLGRDGLYLCDATGSLSPKLAVGRFERPMWFADSKRLVAVHSVTCETWDDLSGLLPERDRNQIVSAAEPVGKALLSYTGKPEDFGKDCVALDGMTIGQIMGLGLYLKDNAEPEIRQKLLKMWGDGPTTLNLLRTVDLSGETAKLGPAIDIGGSFGEVRLAPDGEYVAFVRDAPGSLDKPVKTLLVAATSGITTLQAIANDTGWSFDWAADGRSIVCVKRIGAYHEELAFGAIVAVPVRDGQGRLLKTFDKTEVLAEVVWDDSTKVRCLKDGRTLFASVQTTLPRAHPENSRSPLLFAANAAEDQVIKPLVGETVAATLAKEQLSVKYFEPNADGTVALIAGDRGQTGLIDLKTGEATVIQAKRVDIIDGVFTSASWRTATELCLLIPPGHPAGSPDRVEVALRDKAGQLRCISNTWPDEAVRNFLGRRPR